MANPIKASDLYQDDGAIQRAIEQLSALQKAHEDALKGVKKEAIQLEVSVKKLNATTSQQREEITKTSGQAEEIRKRYEKYTESLNDNAVKIAALKESQRQINNVNKLQAKLASSLEGSYNQLSAQYSLNKVRLNQMSAEQRKATKEGQRLEKQTKEIYEEMKRLQEATGKHVLSVGDYEKALRGVHGPLGGFIDGVRGSIDFLKGKTAALKTSTAGLTGINKVLRLFKIALAATGVGAFVVVLGSLVAMFTRTQEGIDTVNRVLAGLKAGFDVIIDRAAKLGGAIVKLLSGDFKGAAQDARAAVSGLGKELVAETKEAAQLTGTMQQLREESRALEVQTEKSRAKIKELNLIAEDTSKSTRERAAAAKEAFAIESNLLRQREALAQKELATITRQKELGNSLAGDLDEIADKEKELSRIRQQSFELQTTLNNKLNTVRQQGAAAATKQRKEVEELGKQIEEATAKLGGPAKEAELEFKRATERIQQLRMEARRLGADLDFSALEIQAEVQFSRAIDKIRLTVAEELPSVLEQSIDPVTKTFAKLGTLSGRDFNTAFTEEVREIGARLAAEAEKVAAEKGGLFEQLGIIVDDFQLKSSLDTAKKALDDFLKFRVQMADRMVDKSNEEVAATQRALDIEIQNRNAGFAHSVETAQKEVDQARANQQRALREQAKAQAAQRRLETVQQAGNLVTATAKIWAQLGFPFAIPAIAVMWGSFISAKFRAAQLAKQEFGEGGLEFLDFGGSHASGNDIPIGMTKDGRQRTAERGEALAVFNRRNTSKYRSLLPEIIDSINRGVFEARFQRMGASDIPLTVNANTDTRLMEKELSAIRQQGESKYYRDEKGHLVEHYKNLRRVYV